jgi:phage shock protein C
MTAEPSTQFSPEPPPARSMRRLHRSIQNRVLAGVCGGIAEYYGSDPTAVRLAVLVIGLFTGIFPMVILYVVAAVIVPEGGTLEPAERSQVGTGGASLALVFGAILVLIGLAGVANEWLRVDWDLAWPLVLIGLGVTVVVAASRRH